MPKNFHIETSEAEKPLLLIVGRDSPLIEKLIDEYSKSFKIARVGKGFTRVGVYTIAEESAHLIKNLEEKIEYAVVFLEDERVRDYISAILDKLSTDRAKTVLVSKINDISKYHDIILTTKSNPSFYFLITGDIYSESQNFSSNSETYQLIDRAVVDKKVTIKGNDLNTLFCIYYADAILGINHVLFGPFKKQKLYYLFYKHPSTLVSAVHIIERVEPDLHVIYQDQGTVELPEKTLEDLERTLMEKVLSTPVYLDRYFEGFERSVGKFLRRDTTERKDPTQQSFTRATISKQRPKMKFLSSAFLLSALIFLIINVSFFAASLLLVKSSFGQLQKGNLDAAIPQMQGAHTFLQFVDPTASIVTTTASYMGIKSLEKNYSTLSEGVELASIAAGGFGDFNIIKGISRESLDKKLSDSFFLYFQGTKLADETSINTESAKFSDLPSILNFANVAPELLGYSRPKRYLLLFQNNGELRPTGGFIGSVGEMVIDKGKIESIELQDVYEFDGKLKMQVEPPFIVRRYLQKNLYLRDSNFNPDFQETASISAHLFNLESGRKVDGVIGLNFEGVRQIIETVGPINLPSYNKILDGTNTFDFLQSTIDDNFFPGSTQKKDVLQALFNQLMITFEKKDSQVKVAQLFPKLMAEKNLLFSFSDRPVQEIFNVLGYGGEYKDSHTNLNDTIYDVIGINEANVGVNKANIDVAAKTTYRINLANQKLVSQVTHTMDNKSDKTYKTYIRVYTSKGSRLTQIDIDGVKQTIVAAVTNPSVYERSTFKQPTGLEVNEENLSDFKVFGFLASVAPSTSQEITITYDNGEQIPNESVINYRLAVIKQPGTLSRPFTLELSYPNNFAPREVTGAKLSQGKITFDAKLDRDLEFNLKLSRR